MPKQQLDNLITRLHEHLAGQETSEEQQHLLAELTLHSHAPNEPAPAEPGIRDTAALLLESLAEQHPQAAGILQEIMQTLGRLGI